MMQTCVPRNIRFSLWLGMLLSMNSIYLCRLVILQKHIIRNISKSHFNAHTDPIFKDLGILKFNDILLVQLGQFMYCKNSFLPPRVNDNFSRSNQFHSYNTTNSQAYRLPYWRTNTKKFSPFFQGPTFFSSLDKEVINSQSISSFRKTWRFYQIIIYIQVTMRCARTAAGQCRYRAPWD